MLSPQELKRYNRHIILAEIGLEGQEKLKSAKVLVIGAGGLGCPVLQYLTAAGIGTIGIVDFDTIEESNLQRQILFALSDVGKLKAEVAASKLKSQNPFVDFKVFTEKLCTQNAKEIISPFDLIVDGSDNFPTRYLVNDACVMLGKPLVFGSIFKFEGQVSVFNYKGGPTYRCLFPEPPAADEVPNCSQIGVLGVLPGIIGSLQANEALKLVLGLKDPLVGKLLIFDALSMNMNILAFTANEANFNIQEFQNYEEFCGFQEVEETSEGSSKSLTVTEFKAWKEKSKEHFLLDVREIYEYEICNLGGLLLPMRDLQQHIEKIPTDKPVVVLCHHGMRSAMVVKFLTEEFAYKNLYNLEGGIHAWAREIDVEMEQY